MPKKRTTSAVETSNAPPALLDVLRALPERELESLTERIGVTIDSAKRLDPPEQVGRALVMLPDLAEPERLPDPSRELLYRIAESGGVLEVEALPAAVQPLVGRGLVFARAGRGESVELLLPIAHLVHLASWEGEDPRSIRALLTQVTHEVAMGIASHYLGRAATPPVPLALEVAWQALSDARELRDAVRSLAPMERKLLEAIERVGGEVDTEELLELEREPMRLRGATGATPSRRGVGFALERRGYLMPLHPNRHVVPTEVARIVGARRAAERERRRSEIVSLVLEEDHAPHRARFAEDPVPLALGMAMSLRESGVQVRSDVGTPRSLISKFATRFGREPEDVALVAALSRAIGLWDASAVDASAPPGNSHVARLGALLFEAWQRGGAWDEARPHGEVMRAAGESREASAVGVLREMVLDALRELGEGRWIPWEAVAGYVRTDSRTPGLARLIERWAARAGVDPASPAEVARRIALVSLHVLGVVDLGEETEEEGLGPTLRLTPRGRAYLDLDEVEAPTERSRFVDTQTLRIGESALIGQVLTLAPFVEVGRVSGHLDLLVTHAALSQAIAAGVESAVIKERLEELAELSDPVERQLAQAGTVIGRGELVETQGFMWVEDSEVREMLRTRRQTADLFVDPSPPSGLLLAPGVDVERLARRCRALGVEVWVGGEVYRTQSIKPPGRTRSSGSIQAVKQLSTPRKSSGTRAKARSRSSGSVRAQKRRNG